MNDLISHSAILEKLFKKQQPQEGYLDMPEWESDKFRLWRNGVGSAIQPIESSPTVDAVPVVRCGKCKHTETDGCEDPAIYCKKWDKWEMPSDFYCGYGERKSE